MSQPYTTDPDTLKTELPVTNAAIPAAADEILTEPSVPSQTSSGVHENMIKEKARFSTRQSMTMTGITMMLGILVVTQVSAATRDWVKSSISAPSSPAVTATIAPTPTPTPAAAAASAGHRSVSR